MNALAFYGKTEFFDENFESNEYTYLSITNGCYRSIEFTKKALNLIEVGENEKEYMYGILIANNINPKNYDVIPEFLFYDFKYPKKDFIKNLPETIKKEKMYDIIFLCVLNDWKDIYDSIIKNLGDENKNLGFNKMGYSLALYQNKEYYINHQKSLDKENEVKLDESTFFCYLNTNNEQFDSNIQPKIEYWNCEYEVEYIEETEFLGTIEKMDLKNKPSKYEIVNNFGVAYNLYRKGDISNLVLSKLISTNPDYFLDVYKKYKPFILFTRKDILLSRMYRYIEANPLCFYNIKYINILLNPVLMNVSTYSKIPLPEYNLYVIAVKMRNKRIINEILELYKEHGKLYKIMDLKNEKYLDPFEEIYDLPKPKDIDILTGGELNPYF